MTMTMTKTRGEDHPHRGRPAACRSEGQQWMDDAAGGLAFLGEELTQEHEFVATFRYSFGKQNQGSNV